MSKKVINVKAVIAGSLFSIEDFTIINNTSQKKYQNFERRLFIIQKKAFEKNQRPFQ